MKQIAFVIGPECWAGSISLTMELFSVASRLASPREAPTIKLQTISLDNAKVTTFSGLQLCDFTPLAEVQDQYFDAVYLPTFWDAGSGHLEAFAPLYPWLVKQYQGGAYILGMLTGSFLMAEAGLLDGRVATTHWSTARLFADRYPEVHLQAEQLITRDGRLLCSGAINASLDLTFLLIEQFYGASIAQRCERHCLMGTRRTYLAAPVHVETWAEHGDELIHQIQAWLTAHYAEPFSLEEVAARFCIIGRNLRRRFHQACGETLSDYVQRSRIAVAQELLACTQMPSSRICFDVGYPSQTVFGRFFKKHTGKTPSAYRYAHQT